MVLFVVNSAFQMITAVQLKMTAFSHESADILVTDELAHYEKIAKGIEKSGIFSRVYTVKIKDYDWKNWKFTFGGFFYDKDIKSRVRCIKDKHYDVLLYCNYTGFCACLAAFLRRKHHAELMMFEDGFASYSDHWRTGLNKAMHPMSLSDKFVYGVIRRSPYYTTKYWVFNPELIKDWNFGFSIEKIDKINADTLNALNIIYQYDKSPDDYSGVRCIFFEESYYADGIDVGDIEIVDTVAKIIGKDNLMVKIHPRNPENRFERLGYKTNVDTEIPWEIIALNNDFSNTILITIASGSSITSHFISNVSAKMSILLYDMDEIDREKLTPSLVVFDKICRNDKYFVYPKDFSDLKRIINKELEEA